MKKDVKILIVGAIEQLPDESGFRIYSETRPSEFVIATAEQTEGLVTGDTIMYYPYVRIRDDCYGPLIRKCHSTYLFPGVSYAL